MEMINLTRQNVYEIKNENETTFSKAFFLITNLISFSYIFLFN